MMELRGGKAVLSSSPYFGQGKGGVFLCSLFLQFPLLFQTVFYPFLSCLDLCAALDLTWIITFNYIKY